MKEFNTFIREFTGDARKEYMELARGMYALGKIQRIALEHVANRYRAHRKAG